jgi:hypothetical protein
VGNNERREHERYSSNGTFLIYKSVSIISYKVDLKDVSRTGAFIKTKHVPRFGEELTFDILTVNGAKIAAGHGRVARIVKDGTDSVTGFGVHFSKKLPEEILAPLMGDNVKVS